MKWELFWLILGYVIIFAGAFYYDDVVIVLLGLYLVLSVRFDVIERKIEELKNE